MSRSVFRSDDGIIRDTRGIRRFKCSSVDDESVICKSFHEKVHFAEDCLFGIFPENGGFCAIPVYFTLSSRESSRGENLLHEYKKYVPNEWSACVGEKYRFATSQDQKAVMGIESTDEHTQARTS